MLESMRVWFQQQADTVGYTVSDFYGAKILIIETSGVDQAHNWNALQR